ncbi:hypothetical protein [Hydrogenobacter thermophilus]|uniref:hypothetical protein n=1 Tax=Hydrogenobacter thermophilus TaxID=940 RepID=UPI0030F88AC7
MNIQILVQSPEEKQEKLEFLKNWEEIVYRVEVSEYEGCYLMVMEVPDEEFEKLTNIFQSKEEAMGAFLSNAMEYGWEVVPDSYVVFHAQFDGDKLLAGLLPKDKDPAMFDHLHLEEMVREMAKYPRVVVYSYDVVTYIKDIYPEIDSKLYVIAREISKVKGKAPELEELAKMQSANMETLEDKLKFIEELITKPIKVDHEEMVLPPITRPTLIC